MESPWSCGLTNRKGVTDADLSGGEDLEGVTLRGLSTRGEREGGPLVESSPLNRGSLLAKEVCRYWLSGQGHRVGHPVPHFLLQGEQRLCQTSPSGMSSMQRKHEGASPRPDLDDDMVRSGRYLFTETTGVNMPAVTVKVICNLYR